MKLSLKRDVNRRKEEALKQIEELCEVSSERPAEYQIKAELALARHKDLKPEADARGMTLDELCAVILDKDNDYRSAVIAAAVWRTKLKKAIEQCATASEIDSVIQSANSYR